MNLWAIFIVVLLVVINYYYIDQMNKMLQDVKDIKKIVEQSSSTK
jgi:hypothetical protein